MYYYTFNKKNQNINKLIIKLKAESLKGFMDKGRNKF